MVPPVAVQRGPAGPYVFVVGDTPTVTRRQIVLGHEDLTAAVIAEGLAAGERVVVDGAARLSEGSKVNVLPPPTASPGPGQAPVRGQSWQRPKPPGNSG